LLREGFLIRITACLVFREHQLMVHRDIENTAAAGNEFCVDAGGLFNSGSQTDRSGFVVSLRAVGDGNVFRFSHKATLPVCG